VQSCPACLAVLKNPPPDDPLRAAARDPIAPDPFTDEPECQGAMMRYAAALLEEPPSANGSHEDLPPTVFHPGPDEAEATSNPSPDASSIPDDQKPTVTYSGPNAGEVPMHVGRYEIRGVIKEGGMGVVYRAWDPMVRRMLALKMVKPTRLATPDYFERFLREAQSVGQLKHDNIVKILEYGQLEGQPYFTMELADQGSLHDHLKRFQDDVGASVCLMVKVARAMQHVHEHKTIAT
jgi:hypothetical protein